jgi:branched-chain amino acid transport system permease protein
MIMRQSRRLLVFLGACAIYVVGVPIVLSQQPYLLTVAITASVLSVMSLGVWLTFAIGRINMAGAAFAAVGGYITAIMATRFDTSFWLLLPLSGVGAGVVGFIAGYPLLRLKGVYFAMLSLCLTEATRLVFLNWEGLSRGASGLVDLPLPGAVKIAGITLVPVFKAGDRISFYVLASVLLIAAFAALMRIEATQLGAIFRSLRQNEDLSSSLGINVAFYRAIAFAISAALGGLGGSVFTTLQQNIYPTSYQVTDSIYLMMYCFIGGLGSPAGAIVGTFALVIGFEILGALGRYQSIVFAAVMIGSMLALPDGLISFRLRLLRAAGHQAEGMKART